MSRRRGGWPVIGGALPRRGSTCRVPHEPREWRGYNPFRIFTATVSVRKSARCRRMVSTTPPASANDCVPIAPRGMPQHAGSIEGLFIIRRHSAATAAFGDARLNAVSRFSRRHQLSFPYLVWKAGFRYAPITAPPCAEVVTFSVFDRTTRRRDFPRQHILRQVSEAAGREAFPASSGLQLDQIQHSSAPILVEFS